ncbi:MAG: hypothetical protein A3C80_03735 [Candidatus Ryanbacteria bacterium RIFCSPHIGHO2_02_FULL_45_43]|uniref:Uncharacterized protein n=1 Tax=Candidatus Ryanbacteria bacterium RIFCSPHIGHO2_01_45_13 TaxID=1802112 RepID=A0A1G2FZ73_9BACT|nr:MAG: hypothetical protein A2718_02995 [Candidatus Ryanbacteria bacterium RIFCSPHIGHO2_01_FULL_44_130]OGZ43137.1 MAG: hypothetical protein A2W41_00380 [Candidatus Ryanbacteria bacterium RIFCSPHIGHO2_01_45_13]OGZ47788.1 MAG: hypothetical protein A3C80_03735 [Candidatus Ryanbacteria bacterium RIFCSPHIGHO2_02_FULL_45_43]OGZ49681.1 MAG: hypothetical protein A3E55_02190 [Candidatus Ryanbacteria bacterium RIFCSPHIGHO2_12_FULL_44_20]OGZ52174.1 MAG: hypothetical protein A3A17_03055 [Candidatus Ryanba
MSEESTETGSSNDEDEKPAPEDIRLEYQECATLSRFFVGIRFSFFASFITFFVILIGGYHYVWSARRAVFGELQPYLLFVVAFSGLIVAVVGWLVEKRNVFLYRTCDERLQELEEELRIPMGIYRRLRFPTAFSRFLGIPARHVVAIYTMYTAISIVWIILVVYSGYRVWEVW